MRTEGGEERDLETPLRHPEMGAADNLLRGVINLETAMDGRKRTQRAQRKDFEKKSLLTEWVSA